MPRPNPYALADGLRANVDALLGTRKASECIADLNPHLDSGAPVPPEQVAEYRRRLDAYRRTGKPPMQREIDLYPEPPACA